MIRLTAVVLAWGDEPWLWECVDSLLASEDVDVDVVVVDNGCTGDSLAAIKRFSAVRVVVAGGNLGFAGGCNLGAQHATGDYIAFVNSDARVEPPTLKRLADALSRPGVGIASASIRLADDPSLLNSAGSVVNFLGFSWAGGLGCPAAGFPQAGPVASGAGMAVRRDTWTTFGGFCEEYFAYYEDAELSMRVWLAGLEVAYVADAVVVHHYEPSRNARKMYLGERNRLLMVMTVYGWRLLALVAPALLVAECAAFVLSIAHGWAREKVAGWWWIARRLPWVAKRRGAIQRSRVVDDRRFIRLLTTELDPPEVHVPAAGVARSVLRAYWAVVRRVLMVGAKVNARSTA